MFNQLNKAPTWALVTGGVVLALGVAYYIKKGSVANVGAGVVNGALDLTIGGVGLGVGDFLGLPRTEESKCAKAKRLGNRFDASVYCPAAEYLKWQFNW